jgi:hypothetical protein
MAYPPSDITLRFLGGPAPQTLALSEKSPYPRSVPENAKPKRFHGSRRAGYVIFR